MVDYIREALTVMFHAQWHYSESANLVLVQMLHALALRVGFADAWRGEHF